LGTEDRVPSVRLNTTRETLRYRWTVGVYHELAAVDEEAGHLGLGNALTGLLLGRDDGEYCRRAGLGVTWTTPSALPRAFRVRAYTEHHTDAPGGDPFSLGSLSGGAVGFRPNLRAEEGWDVGGAVEVSPWWGTDPRTPQAGATVGLRWGMGDWAYRTATARLATIVPVLSHVRVGAEVVGGRSWGAPPPQRRFVLGGPANLRGYGPRVREGTSMARVRGEVARAYSFGAVTLFGDGGWAGAAGDFDVGDALWSVGVGLALVDDLIRLDAAWGLSGPRGFRLEFYLDGLL